MASSSSPSAEKYPCPSGVNAADCINVRLSAGNYRLWRKLMKSFIKEHGLLGFIKGTVPPPPKMIPDDTSANRTQAIKNPRYLAWKNSDRLLKRWIHSTITEKVLPQTVNKKTAKDVWESLEELFGYKEDDNKIGRTAEATQIESQDLSMYVPLHRAALEGDWQSASEFLEQKDTGAVRAVITECGETALLVAVGPEKRNHFVKKLVEKIESEDREMRSADLAGYLALADANGTTALHIAASFGNMKAAKLLVDKNGELPNKSDKVNEFPIHRAAQCGKRKMIRYLLDKTRPNGVPHPFEGESGVRLVNYLIASSQFGIALSLLKQYPVLVYVEPSPLESLARMTFTFRSGTRLNLWENFIYYFFPISWVLAQLENNESQRRVDIESPAGPAAPARQSGDTIFWKVAQIFDTIFWKVARRFASHIADIQEKKLKHQQAVKLVNHLCEELSKLEYSKGSSFLQRPLIDAISIGNPEVAKAIVSSFPGAIYLRNEKGVNMLNLAIVNRQKELFNFFHKLFNIQDLLQDTDEMGNNGLHLAGALENQQKINLRARAPKPPIQLQHELDWFKKVEKFALPQTKVHRNNEQKTPGLLFTEAHQELVKEAERWMKGTASSCITVGTLITTVVFAAAITVPGGSNERGFPKLAGDRMFDLFSRSESLALVSSAFSVLLFLSLLTSGYEAKRFTLGYPWSWFAALQFLYISLISMMGTFITTLSLVFGRETPRNTSKGTFSLIEMTIIMVLASFLTALSI